MSKETGGPAFPLPSAMPGEAELCGMTLRDYFAAKALSCLDIQAHVEAPAARALASSAYRIADAMLSERAK